MTTLIFITTMSYWVTHAERFKTHQFFPLRVIAFICNALYGLVPMVQILAYEVWLRTYNVSVENVLILSTYVNAGSAKRAPALGPVVRVVDATQLWIGGACVHHAVP